MSAPKGNQFAKGNKGGGRKGYEYEKEQIDKMRDILNKVLVLAEKLADGTITQKERLAFLDLTKVAMKIMDKLHANQQYLIGEFKSEVEIELDKEEEKLLNKLIKKRKEKI